MTEAPAARLKRLVLRSRRRGMLELDLVLGKFAESEIFRLENNDLDAYERLLGEEEALILAWLNGTSRCPDEYQQIVNLIMSCVGRAGAVPE